MDLEEYKTIRDEMLQRFRWTLELSFFAVASTGALLSWLSTGSGRESNPYLFILIGLAIIFFVFYSYRNVLQKTYSLGSYLVLFHEIDKKGFRWHLLSRLRREMIGEKSDWGTDGRRGGLLLVLLSIADIGGPLYLLRENMSILADGCVDVFKLVTIVFSVALLILLSITAYNLFNMAKFMHSDMREWMQVKDEVAKDPNLPVNALKRVMESSHKQKQTPP
jgi:hypothetical protein